MLTPPEVSRASQVSTPVRMPVAMASSSSGMRPKSTGSHPASANRANSVCRLESRI